MGKRVNTTVKERKAFLKKSGYTADDMQRFWNECIGVNTNITMLSKAGHNWTDLLVSQMEKLPTLKAETLKKLAEREEAEREIKEQKAKEIEQRRYYNEHFEEIIVKKIINKEELTKKEIQRILNYEVQSEIGENRRWHRTVKSIVEINEHFFMVEWQEGLTENQENEYNTQPYEVEKHEYEKTIVVTEWIRKGND